MRVYITGLVSDGGKIPEAAREANIRAFFVAEEKVLALGHEPVNPLREFPKGGIDWKEALKQDIGLMMTCDGI